MIKKFFLIALFLLIASNSWATNYYVRTDGHDTNCNGTVDVADSVGVRPNCAWITIDHAADTVASGAGHTIWVNNGTYAERVSDSRSGQDADNMRWYKVTSGTVTVTDGFNLSGNYVGIDGFTTNRLLTHANWGASINCSGQYCKIINNTVEEAGGFGISLATTDGVFSDPSSIGDYSLVDNNTIRNVTTCGIHVRGTGHTITNNDISHIRDLYQGGGAAFTDADGIHIGGSGGTQAISSTISNNYIHDFLWADQVNTTGPDAPHFDAFMWGGTNNIFERNLIFMGNTATWQLEEGHDGNGAGVASLTCGMLGNVSGLIYRNNVCHSWSGLKTALSGTKSNIKFHNNTFRGDLAYTSGAPKGMELLSVTTAEIYNNIFVDFTYRHINISGGSGISEDYNILWKSDDTVCGHSGFTPGAHDLHETNPVFVTNFTDLHLQVSSPAIDAGMTIASVTDDYAGVSRPYNLIYDIGAYEYGGAVIPKLSGVSIVGGSMP